MTSPCLNCPDRWINVHTNPVTRCNQSCERYKVYIRQNKIQETKMSNDITKYIRDLRTYLTPLIKDGRMHALPNDASHLPYLEFLSSTGRNGELRYRRRRYSWAIVDDNLHIIETHKAGHNWSETLYNVLNYDQWKEKWLSLQDDENLDDHQSYLYYCARQSLIEEYPTYYKRWKEEQL